MKKIKPAFKNLFLLTVTATALFACDKDALSLESDISGDNNFEIGDNRYEVIAYTDKLNPVQTNNLPAHLFGFYKDATYGSTTANVVTQLSGVSNPKFPENVQLDSVVLTIPYFSTAVSVENEVTKYKLDSVYGSGKINFNIYENTFFLRGFDPSAELDTPQKYFSDRSYSSTSQIPLSALQGTLIAKVEKFVPDNTEVVTKQDDKVTRSAPVLKVKLDKEFWDTKIIKQSGKPELSNENSFQNYFRGLYFEASPVDNDGTMMMLNFANPKSGITLYYSSPPTGTATERVLGTYQIKLGGNVINFFDNNFTTTIPQGDPINGDEKLYLKGGEGAIALLDLFGGTDIDNDQSTLNPFETFKNKFVETDASGKYVKTKRIINEANLVVYVDQTETQGQEPDRIYIYDTKNGKKLFDYDFDSEDKVAPYNSRSNHLGRLERIGDANSKGVKYKIKITEHIKNLLLKDSTNVTLGLAVSMNVNLENQALQKSILSPDPTSAKTVPASSVLSPKGTVLYGNKASADKKLYLEIFYTEPNN